LVSLGLSQSFAYDDLLHSLLNGSEGCLDRDTAISALAAQLNVMGAAPAPPLLDLPTLASNRVDALQAQVASHLLDIQSRASLPIDGLVFDLLITNNTARDASPGSHVLQMVGMPRFTNSAAAEPMSFLVDNTTPAWSNFLSVASNPDLSFQVGVDFTVAFWASMPPYGDVYVGNLPPTNQIGSGWWVNFSDSRALGIHLQGDGGTDTPFYPSIHISTNRAMSSQWFYVAFVVARSAGLVQYYVNGAKYGQLILSKSTGGFGAGNLVVGGKMGLGSIAGGGQTNVYQPLINELSLWRRALGGTEIASIYNAGLKGLGIIPYSGGLQRSPTPTESLALVHDTMLNLKLMQAFHDAPVPPSRLSYVFAPGSGLQMQVFGQPGMNYSLQTSSDLLNWQTSQANILESTIVKIPTAAVAGARFFRVATSAQ
jgi:hypothetical protein